MSGGPGPRFRVFVGGVVPIGAFDEEIASELLAQADFVIEEAAGYRVDDLLDTDRLLPLDDLDPPITFPPGSKLRCYHRDDTGKLLFTELVGGEAGEAGEAGVP